MAQKMTREELIRLVQRIMNAEGTEEEIDAMIHLLERSVPHPEVADLIFWNKELLTAEEVVDRALSYKPIILPARMERPEDDKR